MIARWAGGGHSFALTVTGATVTQRIHAGPQAREPLEAGITGS